MAAMVETATIGVVGAGAWGTALAQMLAGDGRDVLLWAREAELVAARLGLPGVGLARSAITRSLR